MDGSQKLPQRMLDGIRVHLTQRQPLAAPGARRRGLDALRQRY